MTLAPTVPLCADLQLSASVICITPKQCLAKFEAQVSQIPCPSSRTMRCVFKLVPLVYPRTGLQLRTGLTYWWHILSSTALLPYLTPRIFKTLASMFPAFQTSSQGLVLEDVDSTMCHPGLNSVPTFQTDVDPAVGTLGIRPCEETEGWKKKVQMNKPEHLRPLLLIFLAS